MDAPVLSHESRLLSIGPGKLLRCQPDGGEPRLIRFVALEQDGSVRYDELSFTVSDQWTVSAEEFVARFSGAVIEPYDRVMSDQEWEALTAYLRLAADYGLEPHQLMDFYRFFTALMPSEPPERRKR
ncbi:MAG: hypothetical protein Q8R35_01600 [bacterium]|nr:hypothetical protein [bacterium]